MERIDTKCPGILEAQLSSLAEEEAFYVPLLANAAALLWETLGGPEGKINWAGFYILRDGRLCLGPFQGKAACIHIPLGKGVCGTAAAEVRTVLVPDVHAFPGHIACDAASRSEIVVPLKGPDGSVAAVMDIDSPHPGHFTEYDRETLEAAAKALEENISWQ